jgi:hypothetical protein
VGWLGDGDDEEEAVPHSIQLDGGRRSRCSRSRDDAAADPGSGGETLAQTG